MRKITIFLLLLLFGVMTFAPTVSARRYANGTPIFQVPVGDEDPVVLPRAYASASSSNRGTLDILSSNYWTMLIINAFLGNKQKINEYQHTNVEQSQEAAATESVRRSNNSN